MIYSDGDRYIGLQYSSHKYFFLHWSPKYKFSNFKGPLKEEGFKAVGPTMLVEWNES